jgi:hypothetical protein
MDMRMSVMDGSEATRRIKATPGGRETIILAMTASIFEEGRAAALAEGFDGLMHKPVRPDQIVAALVRHLGVRFVYEDLPVGPAMPIDEGPAPEALDLAGLPAEWVAALQKATIEADLSRIAALAEEAHDQQPAVSLALTEALAQFDYAAILDAIRRCQE